VNRYLLKKFLEGNCTPQEVKQVLDWINHEQYSDDFLKEEWQKTSNEHFQKQDWEEVKSRIEERLNLENLISDITNEKPITPPKRNDRPPFRNQKKGSRAVSTIIMSLLLIFITSAYVYWMNGNIESDKNIAKYKTISKYNPEGQKLTITLQDGSKIILNSDSRLEYPENFVENRNLVLEGEAFFEVAHDPEHPFRVKSKNLITEAIGTSFNISSYTDQATVVSLTEGSVQVYNEKSEQSILLKPGFQITAKNDYDTLISSAFDRELIIGWKDGLLIFQDANPEQIKNRLEHWYDVRIELTGHWNSEWAFSGKFQNESLRNVLEALKFGQNISYNLYGDEVKIIIR
jgi:ferric-dicitrate binding protein FerR (iron transport regulator)